MLIWQWDKENVRVLFSDKDLSEIRNSMGEDISNSKSKHRQDVRDSRYTKHHSLLKLRFSRHKRRTRVLDPDRVQPSWRTWPQDRPLLKLSNNAIHWINLYTADNTIGFPNTNSLESGDL